MLQNARVGTCTAGRAAFDFQLQEFLLEIVEQSIAGEGLLVQTVAAVMHRFGDITIVIPLDVVDTELFDERCHLVVHMSVGVRIGQIEYILGAVGDVFTVWHGLRGGENPIGMLAGAIGVEVHHFRLEPQAELHAEVVHMLGDAIETIRPDLRIDHPVAQTLGVVTALMEPAVVEHEAFHAHGCGAVGKLFQRGFVVVKVHGLPRVKRERTRTRHMLRQGAQPRMETGGHTVKAVCGVREAHLRSRIGFAGGQLNLTRSEQFASADERLVRRHIVDAVGLVAAPCEMTGPDFAFRPLRLTIGSDEHPRAFMAGLAVAAFTGHGTGRHHGGTRLLLKRPTTGELGKGVGPTRHRQGGFQPVDGQCGGIRIVGCVDVGDGLFDQHQATLLDGELQFQFDGVDGVFGHDVQPVGFGFATGSDRRDGDGGPTHEYRPAATIGLQARAAGEGLGTLRQQ